jgi:hypothetical protein
MDSLDSTACPHKDVRTFDGCRCCLSCGFALFLDGSANNGIDTNTTRREMLPQSSVDLQTQPRLYQYRRLNYELGQEIRLIRLKFDTRDEELRCQIFHANLDDSPEYEALSYTWAGQDGKMKMTSRIFCHDGSYIPISTSCDQALRRIRARGTTRVLWIDMISIQQKDISERNHQVGLMDSIYSKAKTVIVDLGEDDSSSRSIFQHLHEATTLERRVDVDNFVSRRWFNRLWVIQEVAVAKQVVVHCGRDVVFWDTLSSYLARFSDVVDLPPTITMNCRHGRLMDAVGLVKFLESVKLCQASEPLDRVYALLGLCKPEVRYMIPVDYSMSFQRLMIRLFHLYRLENGDQLLLSRYLQYSNISISAQVSWMPDWKRGSPYEAITSASVHRVQQHQIWPCNTPLRTANASEIWSGLLSVRGRYLSTVQETTYLHEDLDELSKCQSAKIPSKGILNMLAAPLNPDMSRHERLLAKMANMAMWLALPLHVSQWFELVQRRVASITRDFQLSGEVEPPEISNKISHSSCSMGHLSMLGDMPLQHEFMAVLNRLESLNSADSSLEPSFVAPQGVDNMPPKKDGEVKSVNNYLELSPTGFRTELSAGICMGSIQAGDFLWQLEGHNVFFCLRHVPSPIVQTPEGAPSEHGIESSATTVQIRVLPPAYKIVGVCSYFDARLDGAMCGSCYYPYDTESVRYILEKGSASNENIHERATYGLREWENILLA